MDLSFAPGAQSDNDLGRQCFPFVATDDTSFEDTEDVVITASSPDPELTFTPELDEVSIDIIDDGQCAKQRGGGGGGGGGKLTSKIFFRCSMKSVLSGYRGAPWVFTRSEYYTLIFPSFSVDTLSSVSHSKLIAALDKP